MIVTPGVRIDLLWQDNRNSGVWDEAQKFAGGQWSDCFLIMLGMDAARPKHWTSYGGEPGLSLVLREFSQQLYERGITDELYTALPSRTD